ncbi:MAG: YcaO-like family protein [Desulfovibrionales bacterium]|nr:YcaO-like family protein [Desulfovibrionales bacterium]
MTSSPFDYTLAHQDSMLGVAYFSPQPAEPLALEQCLDHVRRLSNDEFMRAHVRQLLARLDPDALRSLFVQGDAATRSLVLETALLTPALDSFWTEIQSHLGSLIHSTPQVFLASVASPEHLRHAQASRLLARNIFGHEPLPDGLPDLPIPMAALRTTDPGRIRSGLAAPQPCSRRPTTQTYALAMDRLYGLGILDGPEMRHHASLAPWGLLRRWRLDRTVRCGSFDYRLQGTMTSYGRGMCLENARASLAMEIVERYSSFADIRNMRISNAQEGGEIRLARWSQLGDEALNPNSLRLEVPYADQPLHWLEALDKTGQHRLVPVQSVYLFANLDEVRLYSGLGSTGLASGNTPEEAKVSGLLEVIERDSEAVVSFDPGRCFLLESRDEKINGLLDRYRKQGIHPVFHDLTTELGVPCYKCFVHLAEGGLVKATGADLSGPRAALSALTETPFPFPDGPASAPAPRDLPVRVLEDLPDFCTGSAAGNLALLEAILDDQGHVPLYANVTKRELRLPVYRTVVPGLEIVSDFDRFTRVSPRLWYNVLRQKEKDGQPPRQDQG